jgi:hypothetical protein
MSDTRDEDSADDLEDTVSYEPEAGRDSTYDELEADDLDDEGDYDDYVHPSCSSDGVAEIIPVLGIIVLCVIWAVAIAVVCILFRLGILTGPKP